MAKIILSLGNQILREFAIVKERVTIGRRPQNDVVIDDLAVSGEHAAIVNLNGDWVLEDLNSTNGTSVNGQPVKKHYLHDNDVIELAQYTVAFRSHGFSVNHRSERSDQFADCASLEVLDGCLAGQVTPLHRGMTTVGKPQKSVVVFARRSNGKYCVMYVKGEQFPKVNDRTVEDGAHLISDGDIIEISGTRLLFSEGIKAG